MPRKFEQTNQASESKFRIQVSHTAWDTYESTQNVSLVQFNKGVLLADSGLVHDRFISATRV